MADEGRPRPLKRRDILKMAGMVAVAPAAAPFIRQQQGGDDPPPTPLRGGDLVAAPRPVTPPPLPPLNVIALNRLAFGPRPGDLSAFNLLGSTDQERIQAYVDQQLNPGAINDNDCDSRLFAAGYSTLYKSLYQLWVDHFRGDYVAPPLLWKHPGRHGFGRSTANASSLRWWWISGTTISMSTVGII